MTTPGQGVKIKEADITAKFLTGPGQDLVAKLLLQLSKVEPFTMIFGPYKQVDGAKSTDQQRWADYQRMDWAVRQLPAINIFEAQTESKESDNAFLNGGLTIQVFWPPNFRRSDLSRIPAAFKGALQNFFASKYASDMLDELASVQREEKVHGLNMIGNSLSWSPNLEGIIESESVPATILDVSYRIDLRAWYRALEFQGRTKEDPFIDSLGELEGIGIQIDGVDEPDDVIITVPQPNP